MSLLGRVSSVCEEPVSLTRFPPWIGSGLRQVGLLLLAQQPVKPVTVPWGRQDHSHHTCIILSYDYFMSKPIWSLKVTAWGLSMFWSALCRAGLRATRASSAWRKKIFVFQNQAILFLLFQIVYVLIQVHAGAHRGQRSGIPLELEF